MYPAYEDNAKGFAKEADELQQMISTLIALRQQPPNQPFTTAIPEITPITL